MVRVQLFGAFSMERGQSERVAVDSAIRPLASYLFSFPNRPHRKEKVLDLFWRDAPEKQARESLSRASWRIRQQLSSCTTASGICLHANQSEIWLNLPDTNVVDAHCFRTAAVEALSQTSDAVDLRALDGAISHYKGPFLEEFDEDWVLNQREHFQSLYLRSLTVLLTAYAVRKRIEAALACGKRILACDPMRETVQRAVMVLYVMNSQRGEAILQFDRCKQVLRDECDVDPAPETFALMKLIRSGEVYGKLPALLEKEVALCVESDPPLLSLSW